MPMPPVPLILNAIGVVVLTVLVVLQLTVFRPEDMKRSKPKQKRQQMTKQPPCDEAHTSMCTPAKEELQEKEKEQQLR